MMKKEFKYYFSLVTGRVEKILSDEIKLLEAYQIPLSKLPRHNCNKCYGRGYFMFNKENQAYLPCKCVKKVIDTENYNNKQISFYNPK